MAVASSLSSFKVPSCHGLVVGPLGGLGAAFDHSPCGVVVQFERA